MTAQPVGFIGLGNMGGRMTRCLVAAGHDVIGFDPDAERVTAAGARPASSPAEVTTQTDVVLLSLPDWRSSSASSATTTASSARHGPARSSST